MKTGFARALNEIIHDGVATPREMASAAGCSARHIRNVANQKDSTELSAQKMEKLSRWLVDERDEVRHLQGLLGRSGGAYLRPDQAEVDRCLKEEMADIQKEMTYADDALKNGETSAARRHVAKVKGLAKLALEEVEAVSEMHDARGDGRVNLPKRP
jgi:hypothetical protein